MELWNYLGIRGLGPFGPASACTWLVDWLKTDSTYSEDVLTSSREGELEAMTEEQKAWGEIMTDVDITSKTMDGMGPHGTKVGLLRVLGPAHVWALGVGIVLVGEYMGWNFAVGKGGAYAALIACWFAGILYTCVAMID